MTEEEKKAIEYFKKSFISKTPPYWYDDTIENSEIKIKTLVNLIEKLKKENEEYKLLNANIEKANRIIEGKEEYISKDKIREKIKELEEYIVKIEEETCGRCITIGEDMCIRYLKELLEED